MNTAPELDLDAANIPTREAYLRRYENARRDPGPPLGRFHVAFSMYRFAVIFEGIAARARAGPAATRVGDLSFAFARRGLEVLQ